jgi:hypothetical protein
MNIKKCKFIIITVSVCYLNISCWENPDISENVNLPIKPDISKKQSLQKKEVDISGQYEVKYDFGIEKLIIRKNGKYKQSLLDKQGQLLTERDWKDWTVYKDSDGYYRIKFADYVIYSDIYIAH